MRVEIEDVTSHREMVDIFKSLIEHCGILSVTDAFACAADASADDIAEVLAEVDVSSPQLESNKREQANCHEICASLVVALEDLGPQPAYTLG